MAGGNEGSWSHILWSLGPAAIVLVSVRCRVGAMGRAGDSGARTRQGLRARRSERPKVDIASRGSVQVALAILEFLGLGDDHRSAAVGRKPKVLCALLIACSAGSAPMLRVRAPTPTASPSPARVPTASLHDLLWMLNLASGADDHRGRAEDQRKCVPRHG
eukprot:SAG31_NODE_3580_length_4100_cov_8.067483_4_plen_161_part_00